MSDTAIQADARWMPGPRAPTLAPREVHAWLVGLDDTGDDTHAAFDTLGPDERDRARSMRYPIDRRRYIASHGILRQLLARYTHVPAGQIRFASAIGRKPRIAEPVCGGLRFNLSHSGSAMVLILSEGIELGVDIEAHDPAFDWRSVAAQTLTPTEMDALSSASAEDRLALFYRCWVRKEALLKAVGTGLDRPLSNVGIGDPRLTHRPLGIEHDGRRWQLHDLPDIDRHSASMAAEAGIDRIRCWRYEPVPAARAEPSHQAPG